MSIFACMLCCVCLCVCLCVGVCVKISAGGHLKSKVSTSETLRPALPCPCYTLVFSVPRCSVPCQECAILSPSSSPHSYQGTAALLNPAPTLTTNIQTSDTYFVEHTQAGNTHTYCRHTHTYRSARNILFCLIMMTDAHPKKLCSKTNGGRLHKSTGWEGRK